MTKKDKTYPAGDIRAYRVAEHPARDVAWGGVSPRESKTQTIKPADDSTDEIKTKRLFDERLTTNRSTDSVFTLTGKLTRDQIREKVKQMVVAADKIAAEKERNR